MPHLHLSLQSGDDLILKRMKRRHSRVDALQVVEKFRQIRPDVVFGADLIAGFPTETEPMFDNTLRIVEEANLTFLHVFPFSSRPETPAARMPQVERRLVRERAAALRAKGDAQFAAFCAARLGATESVLVEREGVGRTEQFVPVRLSAQVPGEIVNVQIVGADASGLVGTPLRIAA